MWRIVGYIWAFILGVIGISIAAPIIISLIIGGGYILFWIILGGTVIISCLLDELWNKIKNIFKKGE